jgi:apolipoprotein N-acyltransferase
VARVHEDKPLIVAGMNARFSRPNLASAARWLAALEGWRRAAACLAAGAGSVLTLAPFHAWPLGFVTLTAFVWLLDGVAGAPRARLWRAAAAGWWFGFGYFLAGLYWIGYAFLVEADKFAWLMPFAMAILPAGLALFYALAAAAAMAVWRPGARRVFALAVAMFAAEWLRGHILTGFPWNLWGYALAGNDALAQSASLWGIYGVTLLALLIFASPAALAGPAPRPQARSWLLPVLCMGLLAIGWAWGAYRLGAAENRYYPGIHLRIVQGNIPQAEKWKPENRRWILDRLMSLSRSGSSGASMPAGITHLIWPESSMPLLLMLNGRIVYNEVRDMLAGLTGDSGTMILGAERAEGAKREDGRYTIDELYNSLFVIGGGARILGVYDKQHLVPFGEYVPFEKTLGAIGITQLANVKSSFGTAGTRELLAPPNTPAFSPLICYEAVFPGRVSEDGGRAAWLVNLTNDSWFGASTGPYQHLHQARLRAIEEGLPLVRAANTGVSAVTDAYGRVVASLPLNTMGAIDSGLPVGLSDTLFASWGIISLLGVALLFFLLYRVVITVE